LCDEQKKSGSPSLNGRTVCVTSIWGSPQRNFLGSKAQTHNEVNWLIKSIQRPALCLLAIVSLAPIAGSAADTVKRTEGIRVEDFTYASTFEGTSPLYARVVFFESGGTKPMMLLMHGYACNRHHMEYSTADGAGVHRRARGSRLHVRQTHGPRMV